MYVVRIEFDKMETAEFVAKRIKEEFGLNANIGEETTPFEDRDLMDHNRRNQQVVKKLTG